jgi:hypothetical protein
LAGSKHLEFLLENKLIISKPSKVLDELYATGKRSFDAGSLSSSAESPDSKQEEKMALHKSDGKRISEALGIPELDLELDRAVWQVERALKADMELKDEKKNLDQASSDGKEK